MILRPQRSRQIRSSAASDVYMRQLYIPFNLRYPELDGGQPVKGSGDGLSTPCDLYVVAVVSLSDGRHDVSVCQICANTEKAQAI